MVPTLESKFDWQGHRGARGLFPENSIPGFLKAMEFPIQTLELDCVISKDSQVIVSHEPWFSEKFCALPNGDSFTEEQEDNLLILEMNYEEIKQFDCGKNGHPDFPEQQAHSTYKPLLKEVFSSVEEWCNNKQRSIPFFNIEIKSRPEWDNLKTPTPVTFANLVYEVIQPWKEKVCIQSFDVRSLQAIKTIDPDLTTALLVGNNLGFKANLEQLGYTPEIYSPNHSLVTPELIEAAHQLNMRVIPWTVNDQERMKVLIEMGVDGIITDYPNLIDGVNKFIGL